MELGEIQLRVKPEDLYAKSQVVSAKVQEMRQIFINLESSLDKISRYWLGEAAEAYRIKYNEQKDSIEQILNRLGEYPDKLNEIAQRYVQVETEIENIITELPSDIIV